MDQCMNKQADQNKCTVKPVKWQADEETEQVIITYLILDTVFYVKYFPHG